MSDHVIFVKNSNNGNIEFMPRIITCTKRISYIILKNKNIHENNVVQKMRTGVLISWKISYKI